MFPAAKRWNNGLFRTLKSLKLILVIKGIPPDEAILLSGRPVWYLNQQLSKSDKDGGEKKKKREISSSAGWRNPPVKIAGKKADTVSFPLLHRGPINMPY